MTRIAFDRQLRVLQDDLLLLGSMVEVSIDRSVDALARRDLVLSQQVIADDIQLNRKRFEIEETCLDLMATQQPTARDLRAILAVLILANELERMGDYSVGIAKVSLMMADQPLLTPLVNIPRMADKATDMLRRSLDAFVRGDAEAARRLADEDDEVDALNDKVYSDLLEFMLKDPATIQRATWMLWVTHNLERIADRVTNICERVVFMVTGKLEEVNVSTY